MVDNVLESRNNRLGRILSGIVIVEAAVNSVIVLQQMFGFVHIVHRIENNGICPLLTASEYDQRKEIHNPFEYQA